MFTPRITATLLAAVLLAGACFAAGEDGPPGADPIPSGSVAAPESSAPASEGDGPSRTPPQRVLEEIIVTANRRAQNVQDVAGGIRVLEGTDLENTNTSSFEDYVFKIPGADFVDDGATKKVAIRGVSNMALLYGAAGSTASPIGIYLNDTPIQGNGVLPDLDLYDLERIEVLKGPQGTLYGEGAQGGALKMLLNRADPNKLSAKGEIGIGHTYNGSGLNHFEKVAVNAPLYGSWAARLVGTRRVDQGYVDFPNRRTHGEDDATNLMGRIHLDGTLGERLSLSSFLFHQRQRLDQFPTVQLEQGDLRNRHSEPQFADTDFTLGALTLDYDLSFATLTSSTSGFVNDRALLTRFPVIAAIAFGVSGPLLGGGVQDLPQVIDQEWTEANNHQVGITQELRAVSNRGSWLNWVGGLFYRRRSNDFNAFVTNSRSNDPPPVGPGILRFAGSESFEQFALFGETTIHLPWSFQLGMGLRGFREEVALEGNAELHGILYPVAVAGGQPDGKFPRRRFRIPTTAVTPKVSVSWFADDLRMLYAQAAQGVRSGGTNLNSLYTSTPPLFEPDTLWSYELGAKTQWLDGSLTANVAVFYNDWRDLQVLTSQPADIGPLKITEALILNAGRAYTRGLELELAAAPIEDLQTGFNLFVGDGEISKGDPAGTIPDHTRIPQLADHSYSAYAGYTATRWPILGFTPSLQFDTQFTGARTAAPPNSGIRYPLAEFQTYGVLFQFTSEHWETSFGVRNLTDVRPQLGANTLEPKTLSIGRPRTWTVRMGFRF